MTNDAKGAWQTPLHLAAEAEEGGKDVVELLIAKGADIEVRDKDGKTALQLAVGHNHNAAAEILRKAGAKE
jgi:ankyrin repeat protein